MDKKSFLIIGAIVVALVVLYYIASPYQNCKRDIPNLSPQSNKLKNALRGCMENTSW